MLRKALPGDLDFVYSLYMHPQVNPWLLYEPMRKEDFAVIYQQLIDKNVKYIFSVDAVNTGMVKIIPNAHRTSHIAYIGGLAIHPEFNGRGYGKQLMQEIISNAAAKGFLRLELSVAATNEKAISLYEQAGFKKEGILEKYSYLKEEDTYIDEVIMALLF